MIEQWQELKETITEMRDNDGTGTQQEVCKFLVNYMGVLEKQMQEPCEDAISRQAVIDSLHNKFADGFDSDRWWNSMSVLYAINKVPPVNPTKTGHCKDCKWWKDSYGTYCRGVHAESKCPINRKEVYDGNGYCYMFEPKERSDKEC